MIDSPDKLFDAPYSLKKIIAALTDGQKKTRTTLAMLRANNNQFTSSCVYLSVTKEVNVQKEIVQLLANDKQVVCLDLCCESLSCEGLIALGNALAQNTTLRMLTMRGWLVERENTSVSRYQLLKDASDADKKKALESFIQSLKQNKSLWVLDFSHTYIRTAGGQVMEILAPALAELLEANTNLRALHLRRTDLFTEASLRPLMQALSHNKKLWVLDISNNNDKKPKQGHSLESYYRPLVALADSLVPLIADALKINTSLRVLMLGDNHLENEAVILLANVLKKNTCLQELHLDCKESDSTLVGVEGKKALAEMLRVNRTLQVLTLWSKYPRQAEKERLEGFIALLAALKVNRTLRSFSIWNATDSSPTPIALQKEAASQREKAVIDMLTVNQGLTSFTLALYLQDFSYEGLAQVVAALATNMKGSQLQQLVLGEENMRDKNVFPLTEEYLKHHLSDPFSYKQGKQSYQQRQRHKQLYEVIRLILVYHEEARNYQLSLQQHLLTTALILQQPAGATSTEVFFNWQALPPDLLQSILMFSCPVPQYREDFYNQLQEWKEKWNQLSLSFQLEFQQSLLGDKENLLLQLEQAFARELQHHQQQQRELEGSIQFIVQHQGDIRQDAKKGKGIAIRKKMNGHTEFWLNGALLPLVKPQTLPPLPAPPCGDRLPPLPMTPQFRNLPLLPPNTVKKPETIEVNSTKEEKQTLLPSATAPTKQQEKESRRCNIV